MLKKIGLSLASIFLALQSYKLLIMIDMLETESLGIQLLLAWIINMFITGIFAFAGFAFPTQKLLPDSYYAIANPTILQRAYKVLGVELFRKMLLATLWKGQNQRKKYFNGQKNGMANLAEQSMKSEFGHLIPCLILNGIGLYFVVSGLTWLGLFTLLLNFIGNLYPIILQRHHRMRIQHLLTRQRTLIFILFLISLKTATAQGYITISGKIIDKTTRQPIPYAHIGVMSKGTGTIANAQGEFYYRFPRIAAEEDVTVAYLGYKNKAQKGSGFVAGDKNVVLELERAQPVVVDSAYIRGFDARGWVVAALGKVAKNYTETPIMMTGFYQETLQQNNDYVDIREGVLKVEKDPRPKIEVPEKFRLLRGRRYESTTRNKALAEYEFPNGAAIVTRSLETGLPDYLSGSNSADYRFQLDDTIAFYNNKDVYQIRFRPVGPQVKGARNGIICINKADSAIVRIAYDFTAEGMEEVFKSSMKSVMGKVLGKSRRESKRLSSITNYLPYGDKWYLQDSQLLIQTDFIEKSETITGTITLHFVANDILKSNGNAVPPTDQLLDTSLFPTQKVPKYDEVYWSNFNHIIPTADMRKILETLPKK